MNYVFIEAFYFIVWPLVFINILRRRTQAAHDELVILLFAMPLVAVMEARNEFLQAGTGVYYPASLFYFPGFKFPFAILLSSSLFPWVLYVLSRSFASKLGSASTRVEALVQLAAFLVLNCLFFVTEWLGAAWGWWSWHVTPPETPRLWAAKYVFYLWFSLPPLLVAKLLAWHASRQSQEKASPGAGKAHLEVEPGPRAQ